MKPVILAILSLLFVSSAHAQSHQVTLTCKAYGVDADSNQHALLEVQFPFDPAKVPDSLTHPQSNGCVPQSLTSGVYTDKEQFTRLVIDVVNCGNDKRTDGSNPYVVTKFGVGNNEADLVTALKNIGPNGLGSRYTYSHANGSNISTPVGPMKAVTLDCSAQSL